MREIDGNVKVGILDVHISQKIPLLKGDYDQSGWFHVKLRHLNKNVQVLRVQNGTNTTLGLQNSKQVGVEILKSLLHENRDNPQVMDVLKPGGREG